MIEHVDSYLIKSNAPDQFSHAFNQAIHHWFQSRNPGHVDTPRLAHPASMHHQKDIGWSQMIHGFLSNKWKTLYSQSRLNDRVEQWLDHEAETNMQPHISNTPTQTEAQHEVEESPTGNNTPIHWYEGRQAINPTIFIAGLIRTLWETMSDLWAAHLQHVHDTTIQIAQSVELKAIQDQIRALHAAKDNVLADHRDKYFHSNLNNYLQQTPIQQMKTYLDRYRPVILHSIKQATTLATNALKITSFPGFSRQRPTHDKASTVREEPIHRKHTKIRNRSIKDYFKSTNQTKLSKTSHSPKAPD
jgi:hypothetical protein